MVEYTPPDLEKAVLLMSQKIELLRPVPTNGIQVALLDFDGTLSLIRQGWQEVMITYMIEVLGEINSGETVDELATLIKGFVTELTGKQTIYQMLRLADEVRRRGGNPADPVHYKRCYHDRLWQRIENRVTDLRSGKAKPRDWLVPGAIDLLKNLQARGVRLFLASGTDLQFVLDEAGLLGLAPFFEDRIHGAIDNYQDFSKRQLISRIIVDEGLRGSGFVAFGDGYVEIENAKEVGGTAVGVATDELRREGVDSWKRKRLIESGADIIVGDFRSQEVLIAYLFGETELSERPS
jgi:phosphoglycolate phosphatase-like HAD superfamily hydrolase